MFGLGLLVAFALLELYVLWRLASLPWLTRRLSRRGWLMAFGAGVAFFAAARFIAHEVPGGLAAFVEVAGMDLLVALLLAAVCLLPVDLLTLFGRLLPRLARRARAAALGVALLLFGVAVVQGTRAPAVVDYEVSLPELPAARDGMVLVALSDLHLGNVLDADWLAARVRQVQALEPDVIVLLGDTFEGHHRSFDDFVVVLGRLSAPLGVWAITGNHDSPRRGRSSVTALERAGIQLLDDRYVEPCPGVLLAGVGYRRGRHRSGPADPALAELLAGRPAGATILLSHAPERVEQASAAGVALMLAGHTHGGQIWPVSHLVGLRYRWLQGRHQVGRTTLVVSRGTGSWGPRARLWHSAEISRLVLRASR